MIDRDRAVKAEYDKHKIKHDQGYRLLDGVPNESADRVRRVNACWSDCNLEERYDSDSKFDRLCCRNCSGVAFEVLSTGFYESAAQCVQCKFYYIAHSG